ncbi:hypothetical protein A1019T_00128 [Psychrobacter pasteurii]|uniref:Surface-adhesin protein E-like domain-containing protein n=1 Tax=Psychrobacter pasteurii TaxID=1945520 RepID=A0A1R4ECJ5_9GAMM|nr:surface-adhesin E family protein [Psychrobacter pasteurii]SJM36168.1 hypothetical protein A1019T_00128 [Psychrobacter pasteurii]
MKKLALLVVVMLTSLSSNAEDWVFIGRNSQAQDFYVNKDSIREEDGYHYASIEARDAHDVRDDTAATESDKSLTVVDTARFYTQFDCSRNPIMSKDQFATMFLKGQFVQSIVLTGDLTPIEPNTTNYKVASFVCSCY